MLQQTYCHYKISETSSEPSVAKVQQFGMLKNNNLKISLKLQLQIRVHFYCERQSKYNYM